MKTHARVVVIGGGVLGCSIAYHLTRAGCDDVLLLERAELTSGSTWHAAANIHAMHGNASLARLQDYTIKIYDRLEEETGQSVGLHRCGGIYLATSQERFDELKYKEPARGIDERDATKAYYSKLTDIVRRYLDEEVYDRSMESTSSELIERLMLEKEEGKIDLSKETILKLDQILKRADLTKFARTSPGAGQAEADRIVAEEIVKETKEAIPPPTEEELMRDAAYREALAKRRKRKLILTSVLGVFGGKHHAPSWIGKLPPETRAETRRPAAETAVSCPSPLTPGRTSGVFGHHMWQHFAFPRTGR